MSPGMLADRDQQLQKLFADGSTLLSALNDRSNDIEVCSPTPRGLP